MTERLLDLAALALVAFLSVAAVSSLYTFSRTRRRELLIPLLVALGMLGVFLFFGSRFAVPLLGRPGLGFPLATFAANSLLPFAVGVAAGALAWRLLVWVRSRRAVAYALLLLIPLALLAFVLYGSRQELNAAPAEQPAAGSDHPRLEDAYAVPGLRLQVFAANLQEPGALAFDDAGNLYYAEVVDGSIVRLKDTNGDGAADESRVFASGLKNPRGLAWHDGALYVSDRGDESAPIGHPGQVLALRDTNGDGAADETTTILDHLFSLDIQHSNNGIAFGPDGRLYVAIGGPRVHQLELRDKTYWYDGQPRDQWMFGGILVATAEGNNPRLYARGMRNPYALAFGAGGELYATDNGDDTIPVPDGDELNRVKRDADYGYPYFFGLPPDWSGTQAPIVAFQPHSAPTGVVVYDGAKAPPAFKGNILVALYWRARRGVAWREVVRVVAGDKEDKPTWKVEDFVHGIDRPTALAVGPDGAVYIADMRGGKADPEFPGVIFRVSPVP